MGTKIVFRRVLVAFRCGKVGEVEINTKVNEVVCVQIQFWLELVLLIDFICFSFSAEFFFQFIIIWLPILCQTVFRKCCLRLFCPSIASNPNRISHYHKNTHNLRLICLVCEFPVQSALFCSLVVSKITEQFKNWLWAHISNNLSFGLKWSTSLEELNFVYSFYSPPWKRVFSVNRRILCVNSTYTYLLRCNSKPKMLS